MQKWILRRRLEFSPFLFFFLYKNKWTSFFLLFLFFSGGVWGVRGHRALLSLSIESLTLSLSVFS